MATVQLELENGDIVELETEDTPQATPLQAATSNIKNVFKKTGQVIAGQPEAVSEVSSALATDPARALKEKAQEAIGEGVSKVSEKYPKAATNPLIQYPMATAGTVAQMGVEMAPTTAGDIAAMSLPVGKVASEAMGSVGSRALSRAKNALSVTKPAEQEGIINFARAHLENAIKTERNRFGETITKTLEKQPNVPSIKIGEAIDMISESQDPIIKSALKKIPELNNATDVITPQDAQAILSKLSFMTKKVTPMNRPLVDLKDTIMDSVAKNFNELNVNRSQYARFMNDYRTVSRDIESPRILDKIVNNFSNPDVAAKARKILSPEAIQAIERYGQGARDNATMKSLWGLTKKSAILSSALGGTGYGVYKATKR